MANQAGSFRPTNYHKSKSNIDQHHKNQNTIIAQAKITENYQICNREYGTSANKQNDHKQGS